MSSAILQTKLKDLNSRLSNNPKVFVSQEQLCEFLKGNLPNLKYVIEKDAATGLNADVDTWLRELLCYYFVPLCSKYKGLKKLEVQACKSDIAVPVRSLKCRHAEVFDLLVFLKEYRLGNRTCPIAGCGQDINPLQLYVDTRLMHFLTTNDKVIAAFVLKPTFEGMDHLTARGYTFDMFVKAAQETTGHMSTSELKFRPESMSEHRPIYSQVPAYLLETINYEREAQREAREECRASFNLRALHHPSINVSHPFFLFHMVFGNTGIVSDMLANKHRFEFGDKATTVADLFYLFGRTDKTGEISFPRDLLMLLIGCIISRAVVIHVENGKEELAIHYLQCLSTVFGLRKKPRITIWYDTDDNECKHMKDLVEEGNAFQGDVKVEAFKRESLSEMLENEKKEIAKVVAEDTSDTKDFLKRTRNALNAMSECLATLLRLESAKSPDESAKCLAKWQSKSEDPDRAEVERKSVKRLVYFPMSIPNQRLIFDTPRFPFLSDLAFVQVPSGDLNEFHVKIFVSYAAQKQLQDPAGTSLIMANPQTKWLLREFAEKHRSLFLFTQTPKTEKPEPTSEVAFAQSLALYLSEFAVVLFDSEEGRRMCKGLMQLKEKSSMPRQRPLVVLKHSDKGGDQVPTEEVIKMLGTSVTVIQNRTIKHSASASHFTDNCLNVQFLYASQLDKEFAPFWERYGRAQPNPQAVTPRAPTAVVDLKPKSGRQSVLVSARKKKIVMFNAYLREKVAEFVKVSIWKKYSFDLYEELRDTFYGSQFDLRLTKKPSA